MSKAIAYSATGTKTAQTISLPKEVFGEEVKNHRLLQEAYRAYLAAGRASSAKVLTRSEVRGGGRKPHRQKGTGRARAGSNRSPLWRHGGVTFGPTGNENYQVKLPLKAKRKAIRQALTLKAEAGVVKVIEDFKPKDGKTKSAVALLGKLDAKRRVLLVMADKGAEATRATSNLPGVELVAAPYLNVYRVLNADQIIISKNALAAIKVWLAKPAAKGASRG